jgi:hypothetical protein
MEWLAANTGVDARGVEISGVKVKAIARGEVFLVRRGSAKAPVAMYYSKDFRSNQPQSLQIKIHAHLADERRRQSKG